MRLFVISPTYECNLRCKYCYLNNQTKLDHHRLDVNFVKDIILQIKTFLEIRKEKKVTFIWHGGEPLLWGKKNFKNIFQFIKTQLNDFEVHNSIQTNLTLIDNEYLDIFSEYNVSIGGSLDGVKEIHDSLRIRKNGEPTFNTVLNNLTLCRERGLKTNCIVVANKYHVGQIARMYNFLKEKQINFKFNPIFLSGEASIDNDACGITPQQYAEMCIELFELCMSDLDGKIVESNLIEITSNIATNRPRLCAFIRNCQEHFLSITPNGDVLPCGRFGNNELQKFSYGNLHNESLLDIYEKVQKSDIFNRYQFIEKSSCTKCEFMKICHGGCLHDGFLISGDFQHKTFLCEAYKQIFSYIKNRTKIDVRDN